MWKYSLPSFCVWKMEGHQEWPCLWLRSFLNAVVHFRNLVRFRFTIVTPIYCDQLDNIILEVYCTFALLANEYDTIRVSHSAISFCIWIHVTHTLSSRGIVEHEKFIHPIQFDMTRSPNTIYLISNSDLLAFSQIYVYKPESDTFPAFHFLPFGPLFVAAQLIDWFSLFVSFLLLLLSLSPE